jgi:hypothetical protein
MIVVIRLDDHGMVMIVVVIAVIAITVGDNASAEPAQKQQTAAQNKKFSSHDLAPFPP